MNTYGQSLPEPHHPAPQQEPVRYLVLIESAGLMVARLFLESRLPVAEFAASAAEVVAMTSALLPEASAGQPEWDTALAGHSPAERRDAQVFTLQA